MKKIVTCSFMCSLLSKTSVRGNITLNVNNPPGGETQKCKQKQCALIKIKKKAYLILYLPVSL